MSIKKTFIRVLPIGIGLLSLVSCNKITFSEKEVTCYVQSISSAGPVKLYFSNNYPGIPYMNIEDFVELIKGLNASDTKYVLNGKADGNTYKLERENGSSIIFDFGYNAVTCNNINKFKAHSFSVSSLDSRSYDGAFYDESGTKTGDRFNIVKDTREVVETTPKNLYMLLDEYNIKMYKQGDKYLVPFTTLYNIAGLDTTACLYNGENLFFTGQYLNRHGQEFVDKFYSFQQQGRSKELREYNYYELCRDLDYNYGLSAEHNISSFQTFMEDNGLKDLLLSDNKSDECKALFDLQHNYFADSHSGFSIPNAYYGAISKDEQTEINKRLIINPAYMQKQNKNAQIASNRLSYNNINKDGLVLKPINTYTDSNGDKTLIITFDHFIMYKSLDWYYQNFNTVETRKYYMNSEEGIQKEPLLQYDTVALISYANDIVQADAKGDKKIKNVVIDLSGNGGGQADTAIFTLGWLDSAQMQLVDPISDYQGSLTYASDINFDKKVDENDLLVSSASLTDFQKNGGKAYCLTSDTSFSCGNYVPAMLKQSGLVKLVGTKSGGGACIVRVTGTADGSGISFSGNKKLCIVRNGSYYSIDEGIDPDYVLSDANTLYGDKGTAEAGEGTRKNLAEYLNTLK